MERRSGNIVSIEFDLTQIYTTYNYTEVSGVERLLNNEKRLNLIKALLNKPEQWEAILHHGGITFKRIRYDSY